MSEDSDEYLRRQEQAIAVDVRLSGQWGQMAGASPAQVGIADNPSANLAPDRQRNERLLRTMNLQGPSPIPELLFLYGVFALMFNAYSLFSPNLLGKAFVLSGLAGMLGYFVIRRRGSRAAGYYAAISATANVATLGTLLAISSSSLSSGWWTASVSAFSLLAFGVYPLLLLRRKWSVFGEPADRHALPTDS